MGEFLSYSIVGGLLMLAMFLAYRIFLAQENQHSYNRYVILLIYVLAFTTFPIITLLQELTVPATTQNAMDASIETVETAITPLTKPIWGTLLIWVFMAGMTVVAIKTVITWARLMSVIHSGEKIQHDGYVLVLTDNNRFAPFSWMRYIVISRSDYQDNCSAIIAHEMEHIRLHHWIDLSVAQVVCMVNWFNPAAWLMREELMLVHEYQADMAVIDKGHDPQEYQILLVKKAVGARFPSLANSLNHSKLKKRITMMYKEKSGAGRKLKALALVPMIALALGVTAVPAVRAAVATIGSSDVTISKGSENPSDTKIADPVFKVKNLNNNGNETTVTIEGENLGNNLNVSGGTFTTMGRTYSAKSMQCNLTNGSAVITVTFPFTSEYENSSLTLTVNGKDVLFDLESFFKNAQSVQVTGAPSTSAIDVKSLISFTGNGSFPDNITVYLDGKVISHAGLGSIDTSKIAMILVDNDGKEIKIITKK